MKFVHKKHTAIVVKGNGENQLDLEIVPAGTELEDPNDPDGAKIVAIEEEMQSEPIELGDRDLSIESNKLVASCLEENNKFRRIALHGATLGQILTVKIKYLVE